MPLVVAMNSQPTFGVCFGSDGGRGAIKPSIAPSASNAEIDLPAGASSSFTSAGSLMEIFSGRSASSMPPRTHWMSDGLTPWSSSRMARAQTLAVN